MKPVALGILAITLASAASSVVSADDDGWVEVKEKKPQNNHNNWLADPNNFDQWVFQDASNAAEQRKRFVAQLALAIHEIDSACRLDDSQKQRLDLAGRLDIDDFFAEYHRIRDEVYSGEPDQEDFNTVWQVIQPLQAQAQAGLNGEESLLRKVSLKVLSPDQSEALARTEQARRTFKYRAAVRHYLVLIDSTMPLQASQSKQLTELALAKTKPPNRTARNSQQLYVQYQLSKLDPEAIRSIVPGEQGDLLVKLFGQGDRWERHLRQQGVRPHDE